MWMDRKGATIVPRYVIVHSYPVEELLKHKNAISPQELTSAVYKKVQGKLFPSNMKDIVPDSVKSEILKDVHNFVRKCCE